MLPNFNAVQPLATEEEVRAFLDERITTLGRKNVRFIITWWIGVDAYLLELHAIHKKSRQFPCGDVFYLGATCLGNELMPGEYRYDGYKALRATGVQIAKHLRRDYPMLRCRVGRFRKYPTRFRLHIPQNRNRDIQPPGEAANED